MNQRQGWRQSKKVWRWEWYSHKQRSAGIHWLEEVRNRFFPGVWREPDPANSSFQPSDTDFGLLTSKTVLSRTVRESTFLSSKSLTLWKFVHCRKLIESLSRGVLHCASWWTAVISVWMESKENQAKFSELSSFCMPGLFFWILLLLIQNWNLLLNFWFL